MPHRSLAIVLSAIIVASVLAGSTVAVSGFTQPTDSTTATELTSCTTIESPGRYVLTQDITRSEESEGPCITIRANDVTLDGNGHTIDGNDSELGIVTTEAHPVENLTIVDLTVRGNEQNFRFTNVTGGQLRNVSSLNPDLIGIVIERSRHVEIRDSDLDGGIAAAVRVEDSADVTIVNNSFRSSVTLVTFWETNQSTVHGNFFEDPNTAVSIESGSGNIISNNTITGRSHRAVAVHGHNNTIVGNTITLGFDGIEIWGSNHTVANNRVNRMAGWAASAHGVNHTFRNNSFTGGEGVAMSGGALKISGSGYVVENNTLNGVHGVYVYATGPVSIRHNRIDAGHQIEVAESKLCPDPGAVVSVHENVFVHDDHYGPVQFGIRNRDDDVVNATNNYWGAESGPSSFGDEPVTDPVTGTVANGSGMAVSEGVHFDPFLQQSPFNETETQ